MGKEWNRSGSRGLLPGSLSEPSPKDSDSTTDIPGQGRNTRFSRFTQQIRQGLRGARPLLGTRNTEVNKRGEVWALWPAPQGYGWDGMQTANREGITQI